MIRFALLVGVVLCLGCYEDNEVEAEDAAVEPVCVAGEALCDGPSTRRVCLDDGSGWQVEGCGAEVCLDGACVAPACAPGTRRCGERGVEVCAADGSGFGAATACGDDESCVEGVCLAQSCAAGEVACGEGVRLVCRTDGLGWDREACAAGELCVDGACMAPPAMCDAGDVWCSRVAVFECVDGGFVERPCGPGEVCYEGACIGCVRDDDCRQGRVCVEGACEAPPLAVVTEALPVGQVGAAYAVDLEAAHGAPGYTWALVEGMLPRGVGLNGAGELRGTPQRAGEGSITVEVTDEAGATARADFEWRVLGEGLQVATDELPPAEEGVAYSAELEVVGGTGPYGWIVVGGALPAGVMLTGDGRLVGTPSEIGPFPIRVRVVDAGTPPQAAEADLVLNVTVAPLVIVSDMELNLFVARVITLPTLTIIGGNPLPYDTQLVADGGLEPYMWRETEIPAELQQFVQGAGLPDGLVLSPDGRLSGIVEDIGQQVEVQIPFTDIVLTGFFFTAEVDDSQMPPDNDGAIFNLPTLNL